MLDMKLQKHVLAYEKNKDEILVVAVDVRSEGNKFELVPFEKVLFRHILSRSTAQWAEQEKQKMIQRPKEHPLDCVALWDKETQTIPDSKDVIPKLTVRTLTFEL